MESWQVFFYDRRTHDRVQLPSSLSMCGSPIVPRKGDDIVVGVKAVEVERITWNYDALVVTIIGA